MSRQQVLDDPASAYPQLRQLLGAYFHQDWAADRATWEEVVDDYVAESPRSETMTCAEEVRDLLAAGFSDEELGEIVGRLDGALVPSAFHMTTSGWLAAVMRRLDSSG